MTERVGRGTVSQGRRTVPSGPGGTKTVERGTRGCGGERSCWSYNGYPFTSRVASDFLGVFLAVLIVVFGSYVVT